MKLNVYIYIIIITKLNNLNWFVYIYLNLNDFYLFSKYCPLKHGQVHSIPLELLEETDDNDERLNIAVNCSLTRLNNSWMAVELPMNVADLFKPLGGISQTAVLKLFGIHSTK